MATTVSYDGLGRASRVYRRRAIRSTKIFGLLSSRLERRIEGIWVLIKGFDIIANSQLFFLKPFRVPAHAIATFLVGKWFKQNIVRFRRVRASDVRTDLKQEISYDMVFFIPAKSRGWILEGICRDLAKHFRGSSTIHYSYRNLPKARGYFIAHFSQFLQLACHSPHVVDGKTMLFVTHPRDDMQFSMSVYAKVMNCADHVFLMNSGIQSFLNDLGTEPQKQQVVIGAADPEIFRPHERHGHGKIGFCSAYYERKRPELVLEVVRQMPHRQFMLMGRKWENWDRFDELKALPNFEYVQADYSQYPELYRQMDVFVSPAMLEGGPYPLLESMMCNVVPVASRTGFAPDLITDGENGFLFDPMAPAGEVASLVERAFVCRSDISSTVSQYTWRRFASFLETAIGRS